ncbi:MAG TPA: hypothetical protein VHZ06_00210 [Marmoricola sp.]|jgi:hypothetical protein|nr:hypothetical protein [Marmoricola sp.]
MTAAPLSVLGALADSYARSLPVRRVAVVGNAPLEASVERAEAIDAADVVIRVNSFVLDRSDKDGRRGQGRHCDIVLWSRLVPATPDLFDRYRERLYVLLEPMRMYGRPEMWPASWPADLGFVPAPNADVAIPLNEALGVPWREERLAPTTGTTAVWLAAQLWPEAELAVAGMSFIDDPGQTRWEHQFGDWTAVGPEHRIAAEAVLLRGWADDGRITLLR